MTEYIIEWSGIGARIVELMGSVHPCLVVKRLREERLREKIVRCRDCHYVRTCDMHYLMKIETGKSADDGFCAWGKTREYEQS